jgi:hypothetical protein
MGSRISRLDYRSIVVYLCWLLVDERRTSKLFQLDSLELIMRQWRFHGLAVTGILACVAAVLAVTRGGLLGSDKVQAAPSDAIVYSPTLGHVSPYADADDPEDVIASIQRTYGGRHVLGVEIEQPPNSKAPPGLWLHFTVAVPATDQRTGRAGWEADLITGAAAEAFAGPRIGGRISGTTVDGKLPSGEIVPNIDGGMGNIADGQVYSDAVDSAIEQELKAGIFDSNLTPIEIDILHADQSAPAVVARTDDPKAAATNAADTIERLFGRRPPRYEGYYFEVIDAEGKTVFISTAAFRSGAGGLWLSPAVEDVSSLIHG